MNYIAGIRHTHVSRAVRQQLWRAGRNSRQHGLNLRNGCQLSACSNLSPYKYMAAYISSLLFFCCLTLLCRLGFSLRLGQCFTAPSSQVYYSYTVTTLSSFINLNFALSPTFTAALAILQITNSTPSISREDWIHLDPKAATNYDYQGLVTGRTQTPWLPNPGIGSTLHIYLLNFQESQLGCYSLTIDESASVANSCSTLNHYNSTSYCSECSDSKVGVYCTVDEYQMDSGDTNSLSLAALSYSSVRLDAGDAMNITFEGSAGVRLFFQQELQFQELAGLVNYLADNMGQGRVEMVSGITYSRSFGSNNFSIAIGVINTNSYPTSFSISYADDSADSDDSNSMVILASVLGTFITIGIIIVTVFVCRKLREATRVLHEEILLRMRLFNPQALKMSPEDIEFYFPSLQRSLILPSHPTWNHQYKQDKQQEQDQEKEGNEYECCICLCNIEPEQQMKVGYCRHFFHANCLNEWFVKQQNCPYCRQDYSRQATIELYRQLVKLKRKHVEGVELVKSLFRPQMDNTMETLFVEDVADEENQ